MPLVPAYSIAKTFTVAALLADGVDLGSAAGDHLDLPDRYRPLGLRPLMQHTSGLGDYFMLEEYRSAVAARAAAWPDGELLDRCLALPDRGAGNFSYSNVGFAVLRMILEVRTGSSFFDAMKTLVFDPLGMHAVHGLSELSDWGACEQASPSTRSYDPKWVYPRTFLADPETLAHGFRALLRGDLIDPAPLFDAVHVDAPGHTLTEPQYGLGVMIDGDRWVGHGGGGPGFILFALARQDGSASHVAYRATDVDTGDAELIRACLDALADQGTR